MSDASLFVLLQTKTVTMCARSHETDEDEDTYHVTEEDNMSKLMCFVSREVVPNLCDMLRVFGSCTKQFW